MSSQDQIVDHKFQILRTLLQNTWKTLNCYISSLNMYAKFHEIKGIYLFKMYKDVKYTRHMKETIVKRYSIKAIISENCANGNKR